MEYIFSEESDGLDVLEDLLLLILPPAIVRVVHPRLHRRIWPRQWRVRGFRGCAKGPGAGDAATSRLGGLEDRKTGGDVPARGGEAADGRAEEGEG